MKKMYVLLVFFGFGANASAQSLLLSENFDYPAGAQLRDHGWYPHSAASTNPQTITATGLTLGSTSYFGNGIGNAAAVNNTGSDENRPFSSYVDSGNVYVSFLLRVNGPVDSLFNEHFFFLGQYSNTTTPIFTSISSANRGRTFIVPSTTPAQYKLGITFNAGTVTTLGLTTADLDTGQTYLVVLKYQFVPGSSNDSVSLFMFNDGSDISTEPAVPTIGPVAATLIGTPPAPATDLTAAQFVALRQFSATQRITIDGIYVRDHWLLQAANTSVEDEGLAPQFTLYPNPYTDGALFIKSQNDQPIRARLLDLTGRVLFQTPVENGQIMLPKQTAGLYLLQVEQRGKVAIKKLVIR